MNENRKSFQIFKNLKYFKEFFYDSRVSIFKRIRLTLLLLVSIIYFLIPIDIIPDIFWGMGWIEDVIIILAVLAYIDDQIRKYRAVELKDSKIINVNFTEVKKHKKH